MEIVSDHAHLEPDQSMESVLVPVDCSWMELVSTPVHQDTPKSELIARDVNHHVLNAQVHQLSVLTVSILTL